MCDPYICSMESKYKNIQWVVQQNLTNLSDLERLQRACINKHIEYIGIDIIPFTLELPPFDRTRHSIIYGSTTFNALAYESEDLKKGIFFDESHFSIQNYISKWGSNMLNHGASVTTFKKLMEDDIYSPDKLLFIRPDDDHKSFAGETKRFDEIRDWYNSLQSIGSGHLSPDSHIIVAEPYNIKYEWRLWIVGKNVVASSKYREYFTLTKEKGCPEDVVAFAETMCNIYTPHEVFVMDVCLCGDEYFIVECNCMNAAGFYHADIEAVVSSVTDYFYDNCL